jgi:predicted lipid carrier protein YhbT
MFRRQRGATFLGMLIIVAILGFALYAGIRLTPIYLEYMAVARALEQTAKEHSGNQPTQQGLRSSLDRRWVIEDIKSISWRNVEIKRSPNGFLVRAAYRAEAPFIANVKIVVDFDKAVEVR